MRCIIVDDEPLAVEVIEEYVRKVPFLQLVAKCYSAFEALALLQKEDVDLIFLDINMPNLSGVEFMKSLTIRPMVIFTTAYSEYAMDGFDLNAVDYLLKPIVFNRFLKGVNKAHELYSLRFSKGGNVPVEEKSSTEKMSYIIVKADYKSIKVALASILYIEGLKDYVKIYLQDEVKPIVTLGSLKKYEEKLSENGFERVHKSFIVSLNKIDSLTKNRIVISGNWIPLGESYKEAFLSKIDKDRF